MTEGFLYRPRCGVCGKAMVAIPDANRQIPLEIMSLLTMLEMPPSLVKQYNCFFANHGCVWHIPVSGAKDIWVY